MSQYTSIRHSNQDLELENPFFDNCAWQAERWVKSRANTRELCSACRGSYDLSWSGMMLMAARKRAVATLSAAIAPGINAGSKAKARETAAKLMDPPMYVPQRAPAICYSLYCSSLIHMQRPFATGTSHFNRKLDPCVRTPPWLSIAGMSCLACDMDVLLTLQQGNSSLAGFDTSCTTCTCVSCGMRAEISRHCDKGCVMKKMQGSRLSNALKRTESCRSNK